MTAYEVSISKIMASDDDSELDLWGGDDEKWA